MNRTNLDTIAAPSREGVIAFAVVSGLGLFSMVAALASLIAG